MVPWESWNIPSRIPRGDRGDCGTLNGRKCVFIQLFTQIKKLFVGYKRNKINFHLYVLFSYIYVILVENEVMSESCDFLLDFKKSSNT